jgi:DNA-3-methyladenine glycosylase II
MNGRVIETDADVAEGAAWLADREPRFASALELTGKLPLRRREAGFPALLHAICGQQLSVAAAGSVWDKLRAAELTDADGVIACEDQHLRECGLSRPKIKYARALAEADVDYDALAAMPEEDAIKTLTAVKGIGLWTAEIYLKFSVGRADVFAAGDLALQEAARILFELPERPDDKTLRAMAEAWSPWRAVAARLLWAYYRVAKRREGVAS